MIVHGNYLALLLTLPFTFSLISFTKPVAANQCVASGSTLAEAVTRYTAQCENPRRDCDIINGQWFCANIKINSNSLSSVLRLGRTPVELVQESNSNSSQRSNTVAGRSEPAACIDSDGDGWGWNGVSSCRIAEVGRSAPVQIDNASTKDLNPNVFSAAAADCIDTDGDGWGWNGVSSCRIVAGERASSAQIGDADVNSLNSSVLNTPAADCIDTDGDGWGWDGVSSCRVTPSEVSASAQLSDADVKNTRVLNARQTTVADNCSKLQSGSYHITELVTDVFLTAGQSNAAGANTLYQPGRFREDRINNRVLVWTENNRWEIANPRTQTWHNGRFPSGKGRHFNHPAFQIGRAIAQQDECRVVGIIATAASGMPINHWLNNVENHYSEIDEKVTSAINALPGRHEVDMIWWMQGEADDDQIVNRYFWKLNDLINRFRSESWFSTDGYFLANETRKHFYANEAINLLRNDNDEFTDVSRGEHFRDDPFPAIRGQINDVHFNQVSLRKIGDLVADKYLDEYLGTRLEKRSL